MNTEQVLDRLIMLAVYGSHAYGMATETSDIDYRGVCIPPVEYLYGLKKFEQKDSGWNNVSKEFHFLEDDTVVYSIQKFVKLAIDNNPNIIEMLYLDDYTILTDVGRILVENRDLFLSKKARWTYAGYAHSQIKRVERHRRWLLDPPTRKPEPEDFGLTDKTRLKKHEVDAFLVFVYQLVKERFEYIESLNVLSEELRKAIQEADLRHAIVDHQLPEEAIEYARDMTGASENFIELLQKEHQYQAALKKWKAYQSWKKNRNPKRAALEAKCGYDAKHAAQCIRLMRIGAEILEYGTIYVNRRKRGDADYLLEIKNGNVPYEEVVAEAEAIEKSMDRLYKESTLQKTANINKIHELLLEILEQHTK